MALPKGYLQPKFESLMPWPVFLLFITLFPYIVKNSFSVRRSTQNGLSKKRIGQRMHGLTLLNLLGVLGFGLNSIQPDRQWHHWSISVHLLLCFALSCCLSRQDPFPPCRLDTSGERVCSFPSGLGRCPKANTNGISSASLRPCSHLVDHICYVQILESITEAWHDSHAYSWRLMNRE